MAVKYAGLQSKTAEENFLRSTREAVMLDGKNISREEVLIEVAARLANNQPGMLDLDRFIKDLKSGAALQKGKRQN